MPQDLATTLIHHPYQPPEGFAAPQVAVHKASTVLFPNVAAMRERDWKRRDGYTYGLHGTPTTFTLEERIATLEGGRHTVLVPSGLAAIALVNLALLSPGDEVLLPDNVYGPSRVMAMNELKRYGVTHRFYDPLDAASLAAAISPATKLVWLEAAGSVTMEFPDLVGLVAAARARGVCTALDNTWGAGIAFSPFELGIDVVMHALTKYPSGGGDVLMGSVTTRDEALYQALKLCHMHLGFGVGANDVEGVLRGLPSMALRYAASDATSRELARWLQQQPAVTRVLHPALEGSPGHAHWQATCRAAAGLFSILIDPRHDVQAVDRFVDSLRLFGIGYSWAGPRSLAVPYDLTQMRQPVPYAGHLVRLAIGLEGVDDLRADLAQGLSRLN